MAYMLARNEKLNVSNTLYFYVMRLLRLYPALMIVVTFSTLFCFLLNYEIFDNFFKSAKTSLLGLSNYQFWREAGYFDIASNRKPLLHTWSLSLEIQFYLIVPVIFLFVIFLLKRNVWIYYVFFLLSIVVAILLASRFPGAGFYLLPFRAWEFLAGMTIALLRHKIFAIKNIENILNENYLYLSVLLMLAIFLFANSSFHHPGLITLVLLLTSFYYNFCF